MARTKYFLFADEVQPTSPFNVYNFSGIAVQESELHQQIIPGINDAKTNSIGRFGGQSVNLHFYHLVRRKQDFKSIRKEEETRLWAGVIDVLQNSDYALLAGIIGQDLKVFYPHHSVSLSVLAFKTLLQNFARFLHLNNGYGYIIVESSGNDEALTREFYQLMYAGSKYISPKGYHEVFRGIRFEPKNSLVEGLQATDFIANAISRQFCGIDPYKPLGFTQSPFPDIITSKMYGGPMNQPFEFGIKKIF